MVKSDPHVVVTLNFEVEPVLLKEHVAKMKRFGMIVLERGPNYGSTESVMPAHATYWLKRREEGVVLINGPVLEDPNIVGIGLFQTDDREEIEKLMTQDPGIMTGRFSYRFMHLLGTPGDRLR
jgi:hypothetical protein